MGLLTGWNGHKRADQNPLELPAVSRESQLPEPSLSPGAATTTAAQAQSYLCQPAQQPRAPMLREGGGDNASSSWLTVALFRGPPRSYHHGPAVDSHAAHPDIPCMAKFQQLIRKPGQKPRLMVSGMEGELGVGGSHWEVLGGCYLYFRNCNPFFLHQFWLGWGLGVGGGGGGARLGFSPASIWGWGYVECVCVFGGWWKRHHLARGRLIRLLGWVRLHTCCAHTWQSLDTAR